MRGILMLKKIENLPVMKQQSQNELFHRLDKAPRTPAFECEGYWSWGSSVVKGEDGKYHMFVSRFPKSLPFHPGWMIASEIVHAVSDIPEVLTNSAILPCWHMVRNTGTDAPRTIRVS